MALDRADRVVLDAAGRRLTAVRRADRSADGVLRRAAGAVDGGAHVHYRAVPADADLAVGTGGRRRIDAAALPADLAVGAAHARATGPDAAVAALLALLAYAPAAALGLGRRRAAQRQQAAGEAGTEQSQH